MGKFIWGVLCGSVLSPLLAAVVLWTGLISFDANAQPSVWETRLARRAFHASVSRRAARLIDPAAPTEEELLAGLKLFRNNCAGCQGEAGRPSHWGSSGFYPRVPQFGQSPPRLTAPQMFWVVKHGVRYSGMGGWDGELPDREIWRVVAFLARLDSLPPRVRAEWTGAPARPVQ